MISREMAEAFGMYWTATLGCPLTQSGQRGQSYHPGGTESGDRYGLVNGWKSDWQDRAEVVLENWLYPFPGHISLEVKLPACSSASQAMAEWSSYSGDRMACDLALYRISLPPAGLGNPGSAKASLDITYVDTYGRDS